MKALSFKQPWAWLMCKSFKDIENRDWATRFRGRIYIHASKSKSDMGKETLAFILKRLTNRQASEFMLVYTQLTFGAIIGELDITSCVDLHPSPWFFGKYGFTVSNPVLYEKPIPYKGQLGFFNISVGAEQLQEIANRPCKGIICKVTGKQYENGFDQLTKCISCTESNCKAIGKIFKGTPLRRRGL